MPEERFGRKGIKKKSKSTDVSRFIDEGNPNFQELQEKEGEKGDKNLQNPEEQE